MINDPAITDEIARLHDIYERALTANDVAALDSFFWESPHAVRFGVNEHLYGSDAVASYRRTNVPQFSDRTLLRRTVLSIGLDTASVMCELSQKVRGLPKHVRQSQVWVKFPDLGWKIVHAHVSNCDAPAKS